MNALHATVSLAAASLAAFGVGEIVDPELPVPEGLRAKVAQEIRLTWQCEGTNELFGIYESQDLVNWTFREATTNLAWRLAVPSFTDEQRFFKVATLETQQSVSND